MGELFFIVLIFAVVLAIIQRLVLLLSSVLGDILSPIFNFFQKASDLFVKG